ncbi:prepilin-type N-terminal cleavage/methylation domain-containing protein [Schlesneria sp. DSM 10557]|uniref:prepilin-type N-terminal cleavage/methylation domain-containing protein n=1 Tax=Schlesneria sp. DSM 10557 TaxID=3044399 RepID=UPI00359FF9BC
MTRRHNHLRDHRRGGFTLIEIMIVIVIIAILVSILLPTVQSARTRARVVQVKTDISSIEGGISRFRVDFQIDPPSSLVIYESAADWSANATVPAVVKSRALIRQLWPQFDFSINRDINFNGSAEDSFLLAGAECLVFFLGGVPRLNDENGNNVRDPGETLTLSGFSKNPLNPFAVGGNRQGPFYEFLPARLLESPSNLGFFTYKDPLPNQRAPYTYLSSYGGTGYRLADLGTGGLSYWYIQGTNYKSTAWNATKYQIISPGSDGQYGAGGPYLTSTNSSSDPLPGWDLNGQTITTAQREAELDNITNFSSGRLSDK